MWSRKLTAHAAAAKTESTWTHRVAAWVHRDAVWVHRLQVRADARAAGEKTESTWCGWEGWEPDKGEGWAAAQAGGLNEKIWGLEPREGGVSGGGAPRRLRRR